MGRSQAEAAGIASLRCAGRHYILNRITVVGQTPEPVYPCLTVTAKE